MMTQIGGGGQPAAGEKNFICGTKNFFFDKNFICGTKKYFFLQRNYICGPTKKLFVVQTIQGFHASIKIFNLIVF